MTIHRAKGLEFPVVCVADLGRRRRRRPRARCWSAATGASASARAARRRRRVPALAWQRLADAEAAEEAEEERRLFYVAMTRARERLILSGGVDCERWPEPRPGGPPIDWIARALTGDPRRVFTAPETRRRARAGRTGRRACAARSTRPRRSTVLPRAALAPAGRPRAGAPATALPDAPAVLPAAPARPRPAPQRLSYSSLGAYARCGYRFYLRRVLRLPRGRRRRHAPEAPARAGARRRRVRGSIVHRAARGARLRPPGRAGPAVVVELAGECGVELTDDEVADIRALVDAVRHARRCARGWPRHAARVARPRSRSRSTRRAAARWSPASSTCSRSSRTAAC